MTDSELLKMVEQLNEARHNDDHHGAARSGIVGEANLKMILEERGIPLLRIQDEFKEYYNTLTKDQAENIWREKMRLTCPWQPECCYIPDGWIPTTDTTVEIKYGTKQGTTEEKVFLDLEKIRDGAYPKNLTYIFWGTPEKFRSSGRCFAQIFADKCRQENLPVEVIFATRNNGAELNKWLEKQANKSTR